MQVTFQSESFFFDGQQFACQSISRFFVAQTAIGASKMGMPRNFGEPPVQGWCGIDERQKTFGRASELMQKRWNGFACWRLTCTIWSELRYSAASRTIRHHRDRFSTLHVQQP
jgi:anti-sigma-K factor RskA